MRSLPPADHRLALNRRSGFMIRQFTIHCISPIGTPLHHPLAFSDCDHTIHFQSLMRSSVISISHTPSSIPRSPIRLGPSILIHDLTVHDSSHYCYHNCSSANSNNTKAFSDAMMVLSLMRYGSGLLILRDLMALMHSLIYSSLA